MVVITTIILRWSMKIRTAFIGHRDIFNLKLSDKLNKAIREEIEHGCLYFSMGTRGDFDKMALSECRKLRREYKNICIEVVITSLNTIKKASYKR